MSDAELESRLRELELTVKELSALVRAELAELRTLVKLHSATLFGNPGSTEAGTVIRLDRLEQRDATRRWSVRVAIVSAFTALAAYATQLL